jgi:hypothetical protein
MKEKYEEMRKPQTANNRPYSWTCIIDCIVVLHTCVVVFSTFVVSVAKYYTNHWYLDHKLLY